MSFRRPISFLDVLHTQDLSRLEMHFLNLKSEQEVCEVLGVLHEAKWSKGCQRLIKWFCAQSSLFHQACSVNRQADFVGQVAKSAPADPILLDVLLHALQSTKPRPTEYAINRLCGVLPADPVLWETLLTHPLCQSQLIRTHGPVVDCIHAYQEQRRLGQPIDERLEKIYFLIKDNLTVEEAWEGAYHIATAHPKDPSHPTEEEKKHINAILSSWIKMCQSLPLSVQEGIERFTSTQSQSRWFKHTPQWYSAFEDHGIADHVKVTPPHPSQWMKP